MQPAIRSDDTNDSVQDGNTPDSVRVGGMYNRPRDVQLASEGMEGLMSGKMYKKKKNKVGGVHDRPMNIQMAQRGIVPPPPPSMEGSMAGYGEMPRSTMDDMYNRERDIKLKNEGVEGLMSGTTYSTKTLVGGKKKKKKSKKSMYNRERDKQLDSEGWEGLASGKRLYGRDKSSMKQTPGSVNIQFKA